MLQEVPHWLTWPEFSIHQSPVGEMVCRSPVHVVLSALHTGGVGTAFVRMHQDGSVVAIRLAKVLQIEAVSG